MEWARDREILFHKMPREWLPDSPRDKGGGEHHVFSSGGFGALLWLKYTKGTGQKMGLYVEAGLGDTLTETVDATPSEYLTRLATQEKNHPTGLRLVGVWQDAHGNVSVVTTQNHVAGKTVTKSRSWQLLRGDGFVQTGPVEWYREVDNLYVTDLHAGNLMEVENHAVIFDATFIHPDDTLRQSIGRDREIWLFRHPEPI